MYILLACKDDDKIYHGKYNKIDYAKEIVERLKNRNHWSEEYSAILVDDKNYFFYTLNEKQNEWHFSGKMKVNEE